MTDLEQHQDRELYTVVMEHENGVPEIYRFRDPVAAEHRRRDLVLAWQLPVTLIPPKRDAA